MGIVKISDQLHEATKRMAKAMDRSINAQAEHWLRIGKAIEENPNLNYYEVRRQFIQEAMHQEQTEA